MKDKHRIVTVGLSPAWDISCRGKGLEWGLHAELKGQVVRPAGKALNVSRALAWIGRESVAAGLWGRQDYEQMLDALSGLGELVQVKLTRADGHTRQNITVVDTQRRREMHLRAKSELATPESLEKLQGDLRHIVAAADICVFSGAMPAGPLLDPAIAAVRTTRDMGARLAIDTHGAALKTIVDAGLAWLIAPNVEELVGLLGASVPDTPAKLATAGRSLLEKVEVVLISRGKKGALAVTKDGTWTAQCISKGKVLETVGCGDYLLAGFLAAIADGRPIQMALEQAVKVATARAWGWTESKTWRQAKGRISVKTTQLRG
jgi:1-phosphofructokinase family hexose kinase